MRVRVLTVYIDEGSVSVERHCVCIVGASCRYYMVSRSKSMHTIVIYFALRQRIVHVPYRCACAYCLLKSSCRANPELEKGIRCTPIVPTST